MAIDREKQKMAREILRLRRNVGNVRSLETIIENDAEKIQLFRKERKVFNRLLQDCLDCLNNKKLTTYFVKRRLEKHLNRLKKVE